MISVFLDTAIANFVSVYLSESSVTSLTQHSTNVYIQWHEISNVRFLRDGLSCLLDPSGTELTNISFFIVNPFQQKILRLREILLIISGKIFIVFSFF